MTPIQTTIALVTAVAFVGYASWRARQARLQALDTDFLDALEQVTEKLDTGSSLETAFTNLANSRTLKTAPFFAAVIDQTRKGSSFPDALETVSKNSNSRTFSYICEILAISERGGAKLSPSLKRLVNKLREIHRMQTTVMTKSNAPIMIIQTVGIVLLPIIYAFLASMLQSETLDAIALANSSIIIGYLGATAMLVTLLDYAIFRDAAGTALLAPFTISYFILAITTLNPLIYSALGGL